MKKFRFNPNSLLFVFVIVFLVIGIWGDCFDDLWNQTKEFVKNYRQISFAGITDFTKQIDDISNKELSYHGFMMDVNSVKDNLLGTRVVIKEGATVVKSDSDSLCEPREKISDEELDEIVARIKELKDVTERNGAKFLYCLAPRKEYIETLPANEENDYYENHTAFRAKLEEAGVPTLDLAETIEKCGVEKDNWFFKTDHHWRIRTAFLATKGICEELNARYGFPCDASLLDLSNYRSELYPDWFLGSKGKKVGTWFTWGGADDFELIAPDFETDLTEEYPYAEEINRGPFEDTLLHWWWLEKKDYYYRNPYVVYTGGNDYLEIIRNHRNPDGKKILCVMDSFGCAAAPFLALHTGELHLCDMRNYSSYRGEKVNVEEYLKENHPDYVMVLYSGMFPVRDDDGLYNFF